jgi:hypothetical protein
MNRTRPVLAAALSTFAFAFAATSVSAQVGPREPRTYVPPPPSATSTGVAAADAAPGRPGPEELSAPPLLRGCRLETRDALHPEQIELVGLEQSGTPYRPDLVLKRSSLAAHPGTSAANLHERQLAVFSGGVVTTRLPEVAPKLNVRATLAAGASDFANETRPWWALTAVGSIAFSILLVRRKLTRRR